MAKCFFYFRFYGTIYTREIVFLRHTNNITYTRKVQGKQAEPRDVYDVINETLLNVISRYYENQRRDPPQAILTATGGQKLDRQGERGKARV